MTIDILLKILQVVAAVVNFLIMLLGLLSKFFARQIQSLKEKQK